MSITIIELKLRSDSAAPASSSSETTVPEKPILEVTLSITHEKIIKELGKLWRHTAEQHRTWICNASINYLLKVYPELILNLDVDIISYRSIPPTNYQERQFRDDCQLICYEGQLILRYQGKGSIRAILRSMLTQTHLGSEAPLFHMKTEDMPEQINSLLTTQALRSNTPRPSAPAIPCSSSSVTHEPHTTFERPRYQPSLYHLKTFSANALRLETIENQRYFMSTHLGARRRVSEVFASLSELAHFLSRGKTPRSVVFQDDNGHRYGIGSTYHANTVTLYHHLASLTPEQRRDFIRNHARNLGECIALMIYLDHDDFHGANLLLDVIEDYLLVIDFDRCYNTVTRQYRDLRTQKQQDFSKINQLDLYSPFNPVIRHTVNWFTLSQKQLMARKTYLLHTLEKLGTLPELDSIMSSAAFKLGYYTSLLACASLERRHIEACTQQIENPQLKTRMIDDFYARSCELRQQLFCMPEFMTFYEDNEATFHSYLSSLSPALPPLLTNDFHRDVNLAVIKRVDGLYDFYNALETDSSEERRGFFNKRYVYVTLSIKHMDTLLEWIQRQSNFPSAAREKLRETKTKSETALNAYHQDNDALFKRSSIDTAKTTLSTFIQGVRSTLEKLYFFIDSAKTMDEMSLIDLKLLEELILKKISIIPGACLSETFAIKNLWIKNFNTLIILEKTHDPYLIEAASALRPLSLQYMRLINALFNCIMQRVTYISSQPSAHPLNMEFLQDTKAAFELLNTVLNNLRQVGLIAEMEYRRMSTQCHHEINHLIRLKNDIRCRNSELQYVKTCYDSLIELANKIPRALNNLVEQTKKTPQLLSNEWASKPLDEILSQTINNFYFYMSHYKEEFALPEAGRLLCVYADLQKKLFLADYLMLIDKLCEYIEAHPLVLLLPSGSETITSLEVYRNTRTILSVYLTYIEKLTRICEQLGQLSLMAPSHLEQQEQRLNLLKTANEKIQKQLRANDNLARKNLSRFAPYFEKAMNLYTPLFSSIYLCSHNYSRGYALWEVWQQMRLTARQVLAQKTKSSFFSGKNQDEGLQAFLASFSKEPHAEWQPPDSLTQSVRGRSIFQHA